MNNNAITGVFPFSVFERLNQDTIQQLSQRLNMWRNPKTDHAMLSYGSQATIGQFLFKGGA